jgi:hypothetical protein
MASESISIKAPDFQMVKIGIRGTAPLVVNRFSQKAMLIMKETQEAGGAAKSKRTRDPKDFDALFEAAKHVSEEGWEGIHAAAFRNGAISACRAVGFKMTHAKLAFMVVADGIDRVDGAPLVKLASGIAEQWVTPTRNQTGVVDLRSRPMYREWSANLLVRFDAGMLSACDVVNLISRVGMQVGIGEGRPDSKNSAGLGFGLFEVV